MFLLDQQTHKTQLTHPNPKKHPKILHKMPKTNLPKINQPKTLDSRL